MSVGGLARRYVNPLFDVAIEKGDLKQISADLEALDTALCDSQDFKIFIKDPSIRRKVKKAAVEELFAGASPYTLNYLRLIIDKNRTEVLFETRKLFTRMVEAYEGIQQGVVQSAVALSKDQFANIRKSLEKRFQTKIDLHSEVVPELIGGLRIQIGNTVIDATVQNRLKHLKKALAGV